MQIVRLAAGLALSLLSLPALAQQQPASLPQTKAESELNAAWQQMVAAAETAAISGPDQLRAAKAAQGALQAWMDEQRQKLADVTKDSQAKLEQAQRDRLSMSQQVAAVNKRLVDVDKQLADAKKPTSDQKTIAQLNSRIVELQHEADQADQCPHSVAFDEAKIAQLGAELAQARRECARPNTLYGDPKLREVLPSDLPHSAPAPGRK